MLKFLVLGIAILATGCVATERSAQTGPEAADGSLARLLLSGCSETGGGRFDAPPLIVPAEVPPGWEAEESPMNRFTVIFLSCERVQWGNFSRGPISLLFESHESFLAPSECRNGSYDIMNILNSITTDDSEVAAALRGELSLEAYVGNFSKMKDVALTGTSTMTFSWEIDGRQSWLRLNEIENPRNPVPRAYRYAWAHSTGVWIMDFKLDAIQTDLEPLASLGQFESPMLLSASLVQPLIGIGQIDAEVFPEGHLQKFGDFSCLQDF